jgi:ABC-type multidrug transport system fused ATPase/permease subunit
MNNLIQYYTKRIEGNQIILKSVKAKLLASSMIRLGIFVISFTCAYYFFGNAPIVILSIVLGITLFLLLLSRHTDLVRKKKYSQTIIDVNINEINALSSDLYAFGNGKEYKNPLHHFSHDIDLFGEKSFFHHINRTNRKESEQLLAGMLSSNNIDDVVGKQSAIKELAELVDWRQNYSVNTKLIESKVSSKSIFEWLNTYKAFISKPLYYFALVFPLLTVVVFALYFLNLTGETTLMYWLFGGLGITSIFLKKISKLSSNVSEFKDIMNQYSNILVEIENQKFDSTLLMSYQNKIKNDSEKSSTILRQLSKHIDALDQRNNFLFGIVGNGYLLWDIKQVFRIEKWIESNKSNVENWFEVIEFFDAFNSLANFAYNHPSFNYPELNSDHVIKADQLGHFMIDESVRIANDVLIKKNNFIIITGANMAGKSTFLRTIALNIVSANLGLPICAKSFNYNPIKLISSMRTSDSLLDDESYFFSELKRLKFIVDEIKTDEYFIILDEILKGTNSKDKEEGSKKFVKKLVGSKSTGIIATHDLGLCKIAEELPQVKNKYFDAEIVDNELYFDYKYKEGICQNMNASFLLKKMEIV